MIDEKKLNTALDILTRSARSTKKHLAVFGGCGSGKSRLVRDILKDRGIFNFYDIIFYPDNLSGSRLITDYFKATVDSASVSERLDVRVEFRETDFNATRAPYLLKQLRASDKKLFDETIGDLALKPESEYYVAKRKFKTPAIESDKQIYSAFEKKADARLIDKTDVAAIEAFLIDIMSSVFDPEALATEGGENFEKIRVLITLDDFEDISGSVLRFLFSTFFEYSRYKKISEFVSFDTSGVGESLKVSDLFDFRFLIASRENFFDSSSENFADKSLFETIEIDPPTDDEIKAFFSSNNVDPGGFINEILSSARSPFLLELWLEYFRLGKDDIDKTLINQIAAERILKRRGESERDWLRCAAFLEKFDALALRCFPPVGDDYAAAFDFLSRSRLTSGSIDVNGRISIDPASRKFLKYALKRSSPTISEEFELIAKTVEEAAPIIEKLSDRNKEFLRNLAYFARFDKDSAPDAAFREDSEGVRKFVANYPDFFTENKRTYSIKPESRTKLLKLNKLADGSKYEKKFELVRKIWKDTAEEASAKLEEFESKLYDLSKTNESFRKEIEHRKDLREDSKAKIIEIENSIIAGNERLAEDKIGRKMIRSFVYLGFFSIFLLTFLFSDSIGFSFISKGFGKTLVAILAGIGGTLWIIGSVNFLSSLRHKKDFKELERKIEELRVEKRKKIDDVEAASKKIEELENALKKIDIEKKIVARRVADSREILSEKFAD